MLVSIVIPVYNRENYIFTAVKSVLYQTFRHWELLIVDDASTDDTYFSVLNLVDNKKIFYYYLPVNRGVSYARNFGIKHSKGEYIAFLDSDDFWLPEKLEKQIDYMINRNFKICQTDEIWIRKNRFVNPKKKHKKIEGDIFLKSLELCMVSPSAVMINREVFERVGGFDESLTACEDYDLWLRVSLKYKVGLLNEKLIVKRGGHDDQLSKIPGIDRYRIYSLIKLLNEHNLDNFKKKEVLKILGKKVHIYMNGALKRGKKEEYNKYAELLRRVKEQHGN
jgi:glycosyltransferase involved in cell wall biosynthesis